MPSQNSARFIVAFNKIEKTLKEIIGGASYLTFFKAIDLAKKDNATVRKYEDDLREFADLRNAIVHHRTAAEYVIAEPHLEVVELIEHIELLLSQPVTVGTMFARTVHTFDATDSLAKVLRIVKVRNFMQLPIYREEEFIGLITAAGIARWLAQTVEEKIISREMITMNDILKHEKDGKNHRFIASNTSVYEAEEIFKQSVMEGGRLEALLITRTGKKEEKLTGIITPIDLIKIE
ncbi:CBS domain-containing protein [Planococcus shenhongbingii]|uniref:CBS domain-containing protein n=1 Tax=Planococcus shenhongbingii TaxID=3058398 RepID=A0ABT8NAV0_9BACL|nr:MULTISPECIES: CBS domain-containing protein [unclassified Planococcus (in: firmicutes)]MDN7245025.1 CBS domain-containing protein [Planococcus sp. N017]WKA58123.1 CBS domain-containing protein [Planococcus sp. N016]